MLTCCTAQLALHQLYPIQRLIHSPEAKEAQKEMEASGSPFPEAALILEYLGLADQLQHLLPAVVRWAEPCTLEPSLAGPSITAGLEQRIEYVPVTDKMHLLRALVLERFSSLHQAQCPDASSSSSNKPGSQAIHWIRTRLGVLPASEHLEFCVRDLLSSLACSSLAQMRCARELCVAALHASIRPSNCFAILALAHSCKVAQLADAARANALEHFLEALDTDTQGFQALTSEQLVALLSDNNLKVPSESSVFVALMAWCQNKSPMPAHTSTLSSMPSSSSSGSLGEQSDNMMQEDSPAVSPRSQLEEVEAMTLETLSRRCVRAGLMSLSELEALDGSREVARNEEALRLVAGWYIGSLFHSLPHAAYTPRAQTPA